jgi:hypothetical protein
MEIPLVSLASAATEVAEGHFDAARQIFELTRQGASTPDVQAVAEAFGMMAVKIQAREFRLERALDEIRRKNKALEDASRMRAEFGTMASFIVIVLSLYSIALSFMQNVVKMDINIRRASVESISFGFLMLQILLAVAFVMKHRPRPEDYGWTLRNWRRSVAESSAITAVLFALMVGLKALLIRYSSTFHGAPLITWGYWGGWQTVTSYFFVAPAQEVIGRGFLQSSIEKFLTGKHRTLLAIVLTAVQFGVVHLHFSFTAGALAMVSGIIFGRMFARQRTVLGVSISHFILGTLAFGPLQLLGV